MIQMIGNNYCNKEQQDKINNLSNLDEMGLFIDETFYNILIRPLQPPIKEGVVGDTKVSPTIYAVAAADSSLLMK